MLGYNPSRAVEVMGWARGSTGGNTELFCDLEFWHFQSQNPNHWATALKRQLQTFPSGPNCHLCLTLKHLGHSRFLSSEPSLNSPRFLQAVQMLAQCQKNQDESVRATAAALTAYATWPPAESLNRSWNTTHLLFPSPHWINKKR